MKQSILKNNSKQNVTNQILNLLKRVSPAFVSNKQCKHKALLLNETKYEQIKIESVSPLY